MYDVFISFRGEDTRRNFTHHLHSALDQTSIATYTDDNLKKGHAVWPELRSAIANSRIAIVVFSRNYATSKWCLKELVKILKCRKRGQVVMPVFYEVDPSNIRKLTASYGEAFAKHERDFIEKDNEYVQRKVSKWKAALTEAANICGWDSRSRDYKNDSQLIEKIVEDVSKKLDLRSPYELETRGLVEIGKICEDIKLLLSKNQKKNRLLKNYQVIGIWGMGGIGKTTIAKAVFSQNFPQYDSVCFLQNVREESQRLGLTFLQDRLLSELLRDESHKLVGSTFIKRKLNNKKVLIVLDDVDSEDQLCELCKECDHAGLGSKLIITTRNRHLLTRKVDEDDIYEVKTLSFEESLELFSLHAFGRRHPKEGYEDLSKRAVKYAGGVPLALKVLGSNLYSTNSRDIVFWDKELEKLKHYPYDRIQNVLRVSYDGLDSLQKKIFLDIAFFFKDEQKDYVVRVLNACGFYATSGIEVLENRALITISNSSRIQMHDLLQEMGLKIVRQDIEDPGKRSRLRNIEEVSDVLETKNGSDAVEGIKLNLSEIGNLNLNADAFNMMTNLRFLILYIPANKRSGNVEYPRVFDKFPTKLRYLEWHGYRLNSLPPTFSAKMLVEIRLPHSHVKELWSGVKDVVNLEGIDLSECKQLKNLPDLSKALKLKWVNLTGCESLWAVHPSVLSLDSLQTLTLDNCKNLKSLKSDKHLRSLKNLSVNGCTNLKEFSMSSDWIQKLDLSKTGVEKLHPSLGNLTRLCSLNLEGLRLRNLPNELSSIRYLNDLRISNCRVVLDKQKLHVLFEGLTGLRTLYLKDCCKLVELSDNISNLSQLYELRLDGSSVERLPESIKHLNNMEILSLNNCRKLRCLPELPLYIKQFNAANCRSLVTVSTLNTFAKKFLGKDKFISFQNCMKLDGPSLQCIMEGAHLTMQNALTQNEYVRRFRIKVHSYNYTSIRVCFPGSKVPEQFTYRTTNSSIPIRLPSDPSLFGIILCAVLSPSEEIKKHGAKIFCQCYMADGTKLGYATRGHLEAITELNSDHVYIWYDPFHFDSIAASYERQASFMFFVTNDNEERDVLNISTKECGICLIFDPESQHTATITYLGRSVENECSDINNQQRDLSERCSCSCDCLFDVLRCLWRLIST